MARTWLRNGAFAFAVMAVVMGGAISVGSLVSAQAREVALVGAVSQSQLPSEAVTTLGLIASGGPYPYEKDGIVFGNRERLLPKKPRGYYHEYTVSTLTAGNRGPQRIVCGGGRQRIDNCYYTGDHYASFKRIVD